MAMKTIVLAFAVFVMSASLLLAAEGPRPATTPPLPDLLDHPEQVAALLAAKSIAPGNVPNPHWRDDACRACHRGAPTARNVALRNRDINQLCGTCHDSISAHNYIHPVGMKPTPEKFNRMNEELRQTLKRGGGVLTCISCHNLSLQCHKEHRAERSDNPHFFRNGPFKTRTDMCFACHNPSHYERLNPHDQISDEGELKSEVCLVCHTVAPNRREAKGIADVTFKVGENLTLLCNGCHPTAPHPRENHLVKPRPATLQYMKQTEERRKIILPLDPTSGNISCATCHNPHERGVQMLERADRGADDVRRLRVGQPSNLLCMACHDI